MHFSLQIIFELVILAFIAGVCLLGYGAPSYRERATRGQGYYFWFLLGIVAIVVGFLLVILPVA